MPNTCDQCGKMIHQGLELVTPTGTFCDKACHDSETRLPQFEGWDEGSPINLPADLVSRQHNNIFSKWEETARGHA